MMLVHFCSHLTQVFFVKTAHISLLFPMINPRNRFQCFFCWTKSAVGDVWVSESKNLGIRPFSLPTNWVVSCLFCLDIGLRPETWWNFWENSRSRRVESSWKKHPKKNNGCFFFFGTDLKKVQRPDTENSNYPVSSGKLPLVWGVFVYVFLFNLAGLLCILRCLPWKCHEFVEKMFTWIFQESVEMNFQIHNAWQVLGALCGWIKRNRGAEILLFIWR